MIRFLILCIIFFLLYLGFNAISEFDLSVNISVFDYKIQTTVFTLAAIFFITQLVLMVILRIIFLVFDLPFIISQNWNRRKLRKINERLLKVISELFMGNKQSASELINRIIPELGTHNPEFVNLILAETETSFDMRIQHLRSLLGKKSYSTYAAKTLAQIFFDHGYYRESEEYAIKAFNENDTDTQLMIMLIRIYAKTGGWSKMIFIVSKLQRADMKLLISHAEEIAEYYYLAAKSTLAAGNDSEAMSFLESSLELKPDYLEALNLFTELNINMNNSALLLKILKTAFISRPSFEIAQIYAKCSKSSVDVIYGTLASLVKPSEHNGLFLAIAAYLGLQNKITEIKETKLLSYEGKNQ